MPAAVAHEQRSWCHCTPLPPCTPRPPPAWCCLLLCPAGSAARLRHGQQALAAGSASRHRLVRGGPARRAGSEEQHPEEAGRAGGRQGGGQAQAGGAGVPSGGHYVCRKGCRQVFQGAAGFQLHSHVLLRSLCWMLAVLLHRCWSAGLRSPAHCLQALACMRVPCASQCRQQGTATAVCRPPASTSTLSRRAAGPLWRQTCSSPGGLQRCWPLAWTLPSPPAGWLRACCITCRWGWVVTVLRLHYSMRSCSRVSCSCPSGLS
jgi:hypothetical protein